MGWGMNGNWGNMMNGWGYGGVGRYGGMGYMGIGIIGMVIQLIIIIGVILLAVYLIRRIFPHSHGGSAVRQDKGLEILRERYARGEIDADEFQAIKKNLESK